MKLFAITLLAFCCATPSFSQPQKHFSPTGGFFRTDPDNTTWKALHTSIKRLAGESYIRWSQPTGAFYVADSSQYFFDGSNRVQERRNHTLENGNWRLDSRTLFLAYDSTGNAVEEIFQSTIDNGLTWRNENRFKTTFSGTGKTTFSSVEYWNSITQQWNTPIVHSYEYDQFDNVIYSYSNHFNNWNQYTYNANGLPLNILYLVSNETFVWDTSYHQRFVYDTIHPDLPAYIIARDFEPSDSSNWLPADSTTYVYDNLGNMLLSDYFEGQVNEQLGCKRVNRWTQTFDSQNQLSKAEYFEACQGDSIPQWRRTYDIDYGFDADGDPTFTLGIGYYAPDTFFDFHRYTYETVSRVKQPSEPFEFALYPNPASGTMVLKTAQTSPALAKIFDIEGKLVQTQQLQGAETETIRLNGVPAGNYILQVVGKNGATSARPFVHGD